MADLKQTTQYAPSSSEYLKKMMPLVNSAAKKGNEIQQQRAQSAPAPANVSSNRSPVSYPSGVPSPLSNYPITVPYGGSTNYEKNGAHTGLDIGVPGGTNLPAVQGGTVTGVRTGQGWDPNVPSYGSYVTIRDSEGRDWRYSHLQETQVRVGDVIEQGQNFAKSGKSGSTYSSRKGPNGETLPGYHLDLRIKDLAGRYIDPTPYVYGNK